MGFSAIADRMVWLPSLSRDRKWPRPPIRHKTTLWMRVTPVAWKIEQSVMGQKMCFSDIYVLFWLRTNFFNNFHYFWQKTRISLFPQCKSSIDNNSGSIKARVVKFTYSMGFSDIADRMVWPPSLSRDRKWPRPRIQHKRTLGMRVTPVAYKIEQSVTGVTYDALTLCYKLMSFLHWFLLFFNH